MSLATIKKDVSVIVLSGKYKGKTGKVKQLIKGNSIVKAIVEGINVATFHQKPNPNLDIEGGIIKKELPIDICKLARYDMISGKPIKIGIKTLDNGDKVLVNKKTGDQITDE